MKRVLSMVVGILLISNVSFAAVGGYAAEGKIAKKLSSIKVQSARDSLAYIVFRQYLEDKLTNFSGNLEAGDVTKINAVIVEIQEIITELDDLVTKLGVHFPTVEEE